MIVTLVTCALLILLPILAVQLERAFFTSASLSPFYDSSSNASPQSSENASGSATPTTNHAGPHIGTSEEGRRDIDGIEDQEEDVRGHEPSAIKDHMALLDGNRDLDGESGSSSRMRKQATATPTQRKPWDPPFPGSRSVTRKEPWRSLPPVGPISETSSRSERRSDSDDTIRKILAEDRSQGEQEQDLDAWEPRPGEWVEDDMKPLSPGPPRPSGQSPVHPQTSLIVPRKPLQTSDPPAEPRPRLTSSLYFERAPQPQPQPLAGPQPNPKAQPEPNPDAGTPSVATSTYMGLPPKVSEPFESPAQPPRRLSSSLYFQRQPQSQPVNQSPPEPAFESRPQTEARDISGYLDLPRRSLQPFESPAQPPPKLPAPSPLYLERDVRPPSTPPSDLELEPEARLDPETESGTGTKPQVRPEARNSSIWAQIEDELNSTPRLSDQAFEKLVRAASCITPPRSEPPPQSQQAPPPPQNPSPRVLNRGPTIPPLYHRWNQAHPLPLPPPAPPPPPPVPPYDEEEDDSPISSPAPSSLPKDVRGPRKSPVTSALKTIALVLACIVAVFLFAVLIAHCLAWFIVYKTEARLGEAKRGLLRGGEMRMCLCAR